MVETPEDLSATEARIKVINSEAVLLHTQHSRVDIKAVLDRGMYRDSLWSERWSDVHEGPSADSVKHSKDSSRAEHRHSSSSHSNRHDSNTTEVGTVYSPSEATQPDSNEASNVRENDHSHTERAGITTLTLRTDLRLDLER